MGKITSLAKSLKSSVLNIVLTFTLLAASSSSSSENSYKDLLEVGNNVHTFHSKSNKPLINDIRKNGAVAYPVIQINSKSNPSCSNATDGSISISVANGTAPYTYSWTGPGNFSSTTKNIDNLSPGSYSVAVTDSKNASSTKNFILEIKDNIDPTVLTQNITVELDQNGAAVIEASDIDNNSADNCQIQSRSLNISNFDCNNVGSNSVELTVTDVNGNSAKKTATVTVEDNIGPRVLTQNITVELDQNGAAVVEASAIDNGSIDNCQIEGLSLNKTNFDCSNIGDNSVDLTVTDVNGNSAKKTATVTVEDNIAPTVLTQNIIVELDQNGVAVIAPLDIDNGSVDICQIQSRSLDKTNFDCNDIGDNSVELIVTDVNGNSDKKNATVTVEDNIDPEIPQLPDITWSCSEEIINFPTTIDNCDAEITGTTTDPLQFDTYGEHNITWTFTDSSENQITAVQKIIIPEPTVNPVDDIVICNGETISAITFDGSTVGGTTYHWTSDNSSIGTSASGSNQITSFEAKNTTSEIVTATITVTPVANNCEGESTNVTITVNPTPTIATPADIVVCDGEQISGINFSGIAVTGTTISWSNDNTNTGLTASGNGNIPSFTATNTTDESIFSTISVTPRASDCDGIVETFTIEVKPNPTVTAPDPQIYCNGNTADAISLTGSPEGVTYEITDGAQIGLSDRSAASEIPSFTPVNNTNSPVTAEITITPKANGCTGDPVSYSITVNPTPNVSISPSTQAICSEGTTDISLSGNIAGTAFNWTVSEISPVGSITGAEDGSGDRISQTLVNTTTSPATVKYKVLPSANDCSGTPITVTVTVNPTPELQINIPECVPSVDLTSPDIKTGSTTGLTYTYWTNPEATNQLQNPSEIGKGVYYIKGTSGAGCSIVEEVTVGKIQPLITNLADAPSEICSGESFNFLPENNLEGTTISWSREAVGENSATNSSDRNNINPNESLVNNTGAPITARYIFTLENNGCTNEIAVEVEISPAPQLIREPIEDICNGSSINHTPQSSISNSTITWRRNAFAGNPASSGSGTINETLYNDTGVEVGVTYFISITSPKGCTIEESVNFSLLSGPKVTATASDNNLCAGDLVDLSSSFEGEQSVEPVLLDENLNGSGNNWTTYNYSSGGNTTAPRWRLRPNNYTPNYGDYIRSNDGSQFFLSSSDAQGQNTYTETILQYNQSLNTVGYTSLEVSFWNYYRHHNSIGEMEVSTDTNNWERVYRTGGDNKGIVSFDLDGWTGNENLYIRFRYRANWGYWWALDNIKITGEGSTVPDVTWTSSTNPEWTSNEANPSNISVSRTTIFTATYTDPDLECPGVGTVEVQVKDPLQPEITANYCALNQTNQVLLSANGSYDSYRWVASGETISTSGSLQVSLAQTYTLYVTKDGCEASTSITPNENLIANGDFEQGNTNDYQTIYDYVTNDPGRRNELWPEGTYAVGEDAYEYHSNFQGLGHGGRGNFMIVNGDRSTGNVVWQSNIIEIIPDTDYYFSAWTANVNPVSPARLRLQLFVPGSNSPVIESTLGDLTNEPVGHWINFYNPELWNSGNNSEVYLRIINENPTAGGNDFGIDDISFAAFRSFDFEFTPENNGPLCEGDELQLFANLDGGREPVIYKWTGPNGFTSLEENPVIENASLANAGIYTLKITDFYGCDIPSKTTTVEIPAINAGEDLEICAEAAKLGGINLAGTISNLIDLPATGAWVGGSGNFTPNRNDLNAVYFPTDQEIQSGIVTLELQSDNAEISCTDEINITINPTPIIDEIVVTNPLCFEGSDASVKVNVSNGTAPYTIEWSDGQTGEIASGLTALQEEDNFFVTVTDANGCSVTSENIIIAEPGPLEIVSFSATDVTCYGGNDATASIEITGGILEGTTPNYSYQLLNSEGDLVFSEETSENTLTVPELFAGSYTFLVNSNASCAALTQNITIIQPPEIIVDAGEVNMPEQCGITNIALNAVPVDADLGSGMWSIVSGEGGSFEDPSLPNASFSGESNATYELQWTITPATGCEDLTQTIIVQFPQTCSQLDFDGVDDYVDFRNSNNFTQSAFTLEAWVKPSSLTGTRTIISKRDPENANIGYDLILKNGSPSFSVGNKSASSAFRLNTNRWFHIAGVYTPGSELKLYVDGVPIQTNNNGIPSESGDLQTPFLIGAASASGAGEATTDYFNGWIEEVRVWNKVISEEQIRFMMNQRLEKVGNDGIQGAVLEDKVEIPGSLSWSDLSGYYQLWADPDLFIDGRTEDLSQNAIHGDLKNIQSLQQNSAPLPYISNRAGEWFNSATWLYPDVWNPPNSTGINQTTKIDWNIVRLKHNLENPATTNNANNITVLGLLSENGTLNMQGDHGAGANGNGIATGNALTATHYLKLDGNIDLNGESQLIQTEGSILEPTSSGFIQKDQQGTKNSYNYNYWSSPVSETGAPNNSGFTTASVLRDGSNAGNPGEISFGSSHTFADGNYSGNLRISSYWLNIFHGTADVYGAWNSINADTHLEAATGFTMKGPSGSSGISELQNYVFQGKPNNGTITTTISDYENRLVGNPYPSAINAREFILDNLRDVNGGRNDRNVFNGTLYFWDHFGEENTHVLAEYVGGYAAYNLSGGVAGVSNDRRINNSGNRGGSKRPKTAIPAAQGFFINTALDETVAEGITVHGGNVVFKNSQRLYGRKHPSNGNSQFLQPIYPQKKSKASDSEDDRQKIRIDFTSPTGYHRQILVAADQLASSEFDLGYDAPMMDYNAEDMFWMINGGEFIIQAVSDFGVEQVLPIGFVTAEKGEFKIEIAELENIPEEMEIYLRNIEDSTYYDLRTESYESSTEAGYYPEKYELVFQKQEQTEEEEEEEEPKEEFPDEGDVYPDDEDPVGGPKSDIVKDLPGISVEYIMNRKQLVIHNPRSEQVKEVQIFSIDGRLVESFTEVLNEKEITLNIMRPVSTAIYIVKIHTADKVYDKKIIIKK